MTVVYESELGPEDFKKMLGVKRLPQECLEVIGERNFRYHLLSQQEREDKMLEILKILEEDLPVSGPSRKPRWEQGWGENCDEFISSGYKEDALIPGYYRRGASIMRLFGQYILPEDDFFEVSCLKVVQAWLSHTHLKDASHVYEFGCGPAHNLYAFAKVDPAKTYWGMDWTEASQRTIAEISKATGWDIHGKNFDMFNPPQDFCVEPGSAVLSIGMMEQAGKNFKPFSDYLMAQDAEFFLHIEPIIELHDENQLFDYLATKYMRKRNYLDGYLDHLRQLEREGKIVIEDCRSLMGSGFYYGWNLIVWRKA
ncbi:hypothetical protein RYZ26_05460 [Terasakiella sp. A23]|uniref:hypothetical protein n=1 Tax=Terasakiella sp. FCG-A23 TaxID=3080561 RepID=UPI002953E1A8|nr:hypothetical protein [Terasakiella sp. A23]MDV7339028.1 hypothetical protein [Terasakiella sp. A23]